jgi:hypothetical protein
VGEGTSAHLDRLLKADNGRLVARRLCQCAVALAAQCIYLRNCGLRHQRVCVCGVRCATNDTNITNNETRTAMSFAAFTNSTSTSDRTRRSVWRTDNAACQAGGSLPHHRAGAAAAPHLRAHDLRLHLRVPCRVTLVFVLRGAITREHAHG